MPESTILDDAFVATKFTDVDPLTNPVPVIIRGVLTPVAGPWVLESAVTVGLGTPLVELLIVIPEPHVPMGGVAQGAWLAVALDWE
jgi:hypothetical protein